jgi:hypothetical protein
MAEIDWNTELKKIEREFNGLPPEPSPAQLRSQRLAEQRAQQRKTDRANAIGVFARLSLVGLLGAAINFWPYPRDCGAGLYGYMAAEGLIVTGGVWVAACTWRFRMPRVHIIAGLVVLAGLGLLEMEALPRIGYARATGVWSCGDTPGSALPATK